MIGLLCFVLAVLASLFKSKLRLEAENAVLRHLLIVLKRRLHGRVRLTNNDRWFFIQSRAAFLLPSPAETIEPFISICQSCANFSGSRRCASLASPWMIARILPRWIAAARRTGLSISDSRSTLINEQPSNVFLRNQPSNTSKIASNLPSGVE